MYGRGNISSCKANVEILKEVRILTSFGIQNIVPYGTVRFGFRNSDYERYFGILQTYFISTDKLWRCFIKNISCDWVKVTNLRNNLLLAGVWFDLNVNRTTEDFRRVPPEVLFAVADDSVNWQQLHIHTQNLDGWPPGKPIAVNLGPFVSVDLNLWPIVYNSRYRADTEGTRIKPNQTNASVTNRTVNNFSFIYYGNFFLKYLWELLLQFSII